jgi:murein hydrolase activator
MVGLAHEGCFGAAMNQVLAAYGSTDAPWATPRFTEAVIRSRALRRGNSGRKTGSHSSWNCAGADARFAEPGIRSSLFLPRNSGRKTGSHFSWNCFWVPRDLVRCLAVALVLVPLHAAAQDALEQKRAETTNELDQVSGEVTATQEHLKALQAGIAALKKDEATITASLIQSARTDRKLSEDIEDIDGRLAALEAKQAKLRDSLRARRGVLAEVLGALERMGLNPPPALLVRPEDALSSVRSAILLGAVVPEMRVQTEALLADLTGLKRVAASIDQQKAQLTDRRAQQAVEQKRLSALLDQKKQLQQATEANMADEQKKSEELAAKASSLKDLVASIENQIDSVKKVATEAQASEQKRIEAGRQRAQGLSPDSSKLTASADFDQLKGRLVQPVAGRIVHRFGDDDGFGGATQGESLASDPGAVVIAPADGVVLYAGPFRSYGQLLILDAGGGYHMVLAGMGKINATLGQFVLAGEPVGTMAEHLVASAASVDAGGSAPMLYVEIRKDGKPVDSSPWWAERPTGRTRNDT